MRLSPPRPLQPLIECEPRKFAHSLRLEAPNDAWEKNQCCQPRYKTSSHLRQSFAGHWREKTQNICLSLCNKGSDPASQACWPSEIAENRQIGPACRAFLGTGRDPPHKVQSSFGGASTPLIKILAVIRPVDKNRWDRGRSWSRSPFLQSPRPYRRAPKCSLCWPNSLYNRGYTPGRRHSSSP